VNYPSGISNLNLNTASTQTEGFDFETNYRFAMSDIVSDWGGNWTARALATYQPVLQQVLFPGAPKALTTAPRTRFTAFLSYSVDDWTIGLQDKWVSGVVTPTTNNWVKPHVRSWNVLDVNISRDFEIEGGSMTGYVVIQNLINSRPDLYPTTTNIGLDYPAPPESGHHGSLLHDWHPGQSLTAKRGRWPALTPWGPAIAFS
jgi:iron complex outermembrane recepter protein